MVRGKTRILAVGGHPDVCVNDLCEEEGFSEGDYCWNCQASMLEQGFVGKNKCIHWLRKD